MNNKEIAEFLRAEALKAPMKSSHRVTFDVPDTKLKITCNDSVDAIRSVADKFERGVRLGTTGKIARPSIAKGKFTKAAFMAFVDDNEIGNAVEYAKLHDWENLSHTYQALVRPIVHRSVMESITADED